MSLFGTSGIRGPAETLFTNQFCFDIGRTFVTFLNKHREIGALTIGMDPRGSSPRIKNWLICGINFEKREIYDQGATPVPAMSYFEKMNDYIVGSIMVSGSHIQANLNGIKFFAFQGEILKEHEEEIDDLYLSLKNKVKFAEKSEVQLDNKANAMYQEMLLALADKYPRWKAVVDTGDGAQSDTMPIVLKELGLNVIEMNTTIQGEFFARDTEVEEDFANLKKRVLVEKADFGMGFDADGDRVVFIDENGKFVPGDYTCTLIAKELSWGAVVTPISTSQVVDYIDRKVFRTKVGSPFVVDKMRKVNAPFGFEANGGGISQEIMMSRDGGSTAIKVLNILKKKKKSLSRTISELPKFYLFKTKFTYDWEKKDEILSKAKKEFQGIKNEEMDGLKIWMNDNTWILFRSSLNAPEFRIFAESKSEAEAISLIDKGSEFVNRIII